MKKDRKRKPAAAADANGGIRMNLVMLLKTALGYQQAGHLAEAEKFYRKVLQADPGNAIANQLMGGIAQQKGAQQQAADFFATALRSNPDNAEIHNNLGRSLNALGRNDEAIRHFERALKLDPDYAVAHNNLGAALVGTERSGEAVEHINRSLQLRPDNASAHNNLGNALKEDGKFSEAVGQYNQALKLNPEFPDAYYNLGVAFEHENMFGDAMDAYEIAVKMRPDFAEAHYNMGNVCMSVGNIEEARGRYDKALEANPEYAEAHNNMGILLRKTGRFEEAEKSWRSASGLQPDFAQADSNLANVLRESGRLEDAATVYRRAIAIRPDYAEAHNNLGIALSESGLLEEAEQSFRRAIELDPDFADAHMNLAIVLFMCGDLTNGWREYEWRLKAKDVETPKRAFPQPHWDGSSLEGKSILLWAEQGVGDEIRYASMIPEMLEKCASVAIECAPRLVDLLARSFPQATVYGYPFDDGESGEAHFDFQCPLPGLGRFLRPTIEAFAGQRQSYLVADPERTEFWRRRLAEISSRPKIGINWRSMRVINKWRHFYADIDDLAPVMRIPGVDFVNMTYAVKDDELAGLEELYGVKLLGWDDIDMKDDMDGFAALNASLDMVVSCLSYVSEMSGALGVPTLGFIGERRNYNMLGTGDAIWYPGTKYFSKDREQSWRPVFEDMAREIRRKLALS